VQDEVQDEWQDPWHWYTVDDRPWTDADTRAFQERGHDGVRMSFGRGHGVKLAFLAGLPGLTALEIDGPVTDDRAVFELTGLRDLTLLTRSRKPAAFDRLPELESLVTTDRPGLDTIAVLPRVTNLVIGRWTGTTPDFLGAKTALERLRLEGRGQTADLAGLEHCTAMQDLWLFDFNPSSLEPCRPLRSLTHVQITGTGGPDGAGPLDLDPFAGMARLEWFHVTELGPLKSLRPVREMPALQGVAVSGCTVADGDLSPLADLGSEVIVVPPAR
jgi:hypothetical protein